MNFHIKLIFILLFFTSSHAQEIECGWYGKKSIVERDKMFPFSEAKKVLLISFPTQREIYQEKLSNENKYKILKSFSLDRDTIPTVYEATEIVEIQKNEIDKLSNLLFNFKIKKLPKRYSLTFINCYQPRNAILFFDENDVIISSLEICFQCLQAYLSPDEYEINKLVNIESCSERMNFLKDLFKSNGIKYGIEE